MTVYGAVVTLLLVFPWALVMAPLVFVLGGAQAGAPGKALLSIAREARCFHVGASAWSYRVTTESGTR